MTEEKILKIGEFAPDFAFISIFDKQNKKLSDYLNKKVVLYFYPKDFTQGCTVEASEFVKDYEKFRQQDITIIGISPDDLESHIKFKDKMNIQYELVSDKDNAISKNYGVYGLKNFMGRKYMGVHRTTFLIDKEGKILHIFKKVKPLGHSNEILEILSK